MKTLMTYPLSAAVLMGIAQWTLAASTGRIEIVPEPVWSFTSGAPIYGDGSVDATAVYFANTAGVVYAVNKSTGAQLWEYQSGGAIYSGVHRGNDSVYFLSDDGYSYKLDAHSGALIWRVPAPGTSTRTPLLGNNSNFDYRSSTPVERGGKVYFATGTGLIQAVDAATGASLWQFQTDGTIRADPEVTEDYVIAGSFGGTLYCLDRATGALVWEYDTRTGLDDTPRDYTINSPATVVGDTVYIGTRSTYLFALELATGALKWSYPYYSSWVESPISYYDGSVYAGSSFLRAQFAFDADDGELQWRYNRTHGLSYSRLTPTETALYAGTVAVPGLQYEGFLTQGGLLRLDRLSGEPVWFYAMPENPLLTELGVISAPIVNEDRIYFGSLDGKFQALAEITYEYPILNFAADRDELKLDEKTVLRWEVIDDHQVRLNGRKVPNKGQRVVRAKADQTYTLSVEGRLREERQVLLDVKPAETINLAKFGTATATSTEDPLQYGAEAAIDDDASTRWASLFEDGQSLTLDLGRVYPIERVVIHWEGAYASAYHLEASTDLCHWTRVFETSANQGGRDEIAGLGASGRYLRLVADERATEWGVSIYEIEVYEGADPLQCE